MMYVPVIIVPHRDGGMIANRKAASKLAKKKRPWWKVGTELTEKKNTEGGRVPKCSEIKKQSTQYFVPDLRHASFGPICGHVRMSKNACVLIFPANEKKQQINTHASRISANLGHPNRACPVWRQVHT